MLLAGGARCVRGRVANCEQIRWQPAARLLLPIRCSFSQGREHRRQIASVSLPFICGALPRGHCALPPGKSGALLSPRIQENWSRWPCPSDEEHLTEETRLRPKLGTNVLRCTGSHPTHLLCRSHPTTVAHRSTKSVGDLAARPQGGVGDVLRALGGGVVLESLVVAGAARREAREGSHGRRAGKRAPFGTSSIRRAHGRRRRRAEPIASLCNSREPIDARTGSCRRSGSWCI